MSKFKITYGILVLSLLFLISCDGSNPKAENPDFIFNKFPNAVGMYWEYEIYDSLTSTYDTAFVSITGDTTYSNNLEPVIMKRTLIPGNSYDHVINEYNHLENNILHIYSDDMVQELEETFQFPIKLDNSWSVNDYDNSIVTDSGFISVPAGDFGTAYQIDRHWLLDFEGGGHHSSTWLVPNIGMVQKRILKQYSDGASLYTTKNEVWKLIHYNLYTFSQDDFPNSVGTWWSYEAYDPNFRTYDTLTVEIIEEIVFAEDTIATLWKYESSFFNDTLFVHNKGNKIIVSEDTLSMWSAHNYIFPLAIGRSWRDSLIIYGESDIFGKDSVTVPAGTFKNGFYYYHQQNGYNSHESIAEWLVPEIGMVKRTWITHELGPGFHVELSLIDYKIK